MKILTSAIRTFFTLILLLPVGTTFAGEISTVINGKSFHVGSHETWNEKNYGLGIEYHFDSASKWKPVIMANGFRDSHDNMSYMAGGGLHRNMFTSERLHGAYVDLGLNAFLMTRVGVNGGNPFPGALPSLTVGNRYIGINLSYLPKAAIKRLTPKDSMDKNMKGVVFVQFKMSMSRLLPFQ